MVWQQGWTKYFPAVRLFADFFRSSSVGLAVFDSQLRYTAINEYLAATHGSSVEAHIGKHVRDVLGNLAPQVEPALEEVFATGQPVFSIEVVGPLPGRIHGARWFDNFFPISDSTGKVTEVGAVVVEVPKHARLHMTHKKALPSGTVIRSWKDIARYVGTSVKTVQRWEQAHGFPVRRLTHKKGAVVFALMSEVDEWLSRSSRCVLGTGSGPLV